MPTSQFTVLLISCLLFQSRAQNAGVTGSLPASNDRGLKEDKVEAGKQLRDKFNEHAPKIDSAIQEIKSMQQNLTFESQSASSELMQISKSQEKRMTEAALQLYMKGLAESKDPEYFDCVSQQLHNGMKNILTHQINCTNDFMGMEHSGRTLERKLIEMLKGVWTQLFSIFNESDRKIQSAANSLIVKSELKKALQEMDKVAESVPDVLKDANKFMLGFIANVRERRESCIEELSNVADKGIQDMTDNC